MRSVEPEEWGEPMQTNDGAVTIDEGDGVKSRPISSRFWLKGGRYRVKMPSGGGNTRRWTNAKSARQASLLYSESPGPVGTNFFRLKQGFYRFVLTGPTEKQPKSVEITRLEAP